MSIVNFAIAQPLERQISQVIKEYGFGSKAEFFRFLAINFVNNKKQSLPFENDPEIAYLTSEIEKASRRKFAGKKLPSAKEQLVDL